MGSKGQAGIPAVYDVVRCVPGETPVRTLEAVERELSFEVFADGGFVVRTRCTASNLAELAVGRLLTSGIVSSAIDVASVSVAEDGSRADVRLSPAARRAFAVRRSWGAMGLPGGVRSAELGGLQAVRPVPWSPEDVFCLAAEFERDRTSHRVTRGVHSAYVCQGRKVLLCREDIGRHNALDKALGAALLEGFDLSRCAVFSSGRAPEDMVAKAIRAGVPILITKAVPTAEGIELARAHGLTLISKATSAGADVVSDPLGVAAGVEVARRGQAVDENEALARPA